MWCQSLPPVGDKHAKVLILGSMPGAASLYAQQYYAHPRNHFWPLIFTVLECSLPDHYSQRIQVLRENDIALWDVVAECERVGSSDAAITQVKPNDFADFFSGHPDIGLVAFNGAKAAELWRKHVRIDQQNVEYVTLPSTSPALTRSLAEKTRMWMVVKEYR